jgi:hypothetical protein
MRAFADVLRAEISRPYDGAVVETWAVAAQATADETHLHLLYPLSAALDFLPDLRVTELVLIPPGSSGVREVAEVYVRTRRR